MVGIDPAKPMLLQAIKKDKDQKIKYIHGGYKKLKNLKAELVLMTSHVSQFIIDDEEWNIFLQNSYNVLESEWYILFDSKNPLLKPWENYTTEKYNITKDTKFGQVNLQIEAWEKFWNVITHHLYYKFLETWEQCISNNTLVYRTQQNLVVSLRENGFQIIKIYGGWTWTDYTDLSSEMIFLAKKIS